MKIEIEPGEMWESGPCSDCESSTRSIWGYVYKENNAYAVYYARWTENHLERGIEILLSIGQWGEGTSGEMRNRVGVKCQIDSAVPAFMIVDASTMPWNDEKVLGKALTREDVLTNSIKDEAFHILDHLVFDDQRLKDFILSDKH